MPKRKLTPARRAAIVKWQLAGARASATQRKLQGMPKMYRIPMGKTPLLYHNTTSARADAIVRERVWKPQVSPKNVFFRQPSAKDNWEYYGKSIVGVKVPRKFIKRESGSRGLLGYAHQTFTVEKRHLRGRQVRRIK